jgi:hypothetical protein
MSDYTVFDDITNTLMSLLRGNIGALMPPDRISGDSPAEIADDTQPSLSLYLYQIGENRHLKNIGMSETDSGDLRYPPLPVQLFYLMTSYAKSRDTEQQIMGRAMQILNDNATICGSMLRGGLAGSCEEVVVTVNPLSLDEMNKLWSLFCGKSYRLSVSYQVSPVLIDSTRERAAERIIRHTTKYVPV